MQIKKQKIYRKRRITCSLLLILIVTASIITVNNFPRIMSEDEPVDNDFIQNINSDISPVETTSAEVHVLEEIPAINVVYPVATDKTADFNTDLISSEYGVLIDVDDHTILAGRGCNERICPASLTKVMTLIVAVENINDLNATFTMTNEILEPLINQDATRAGFKENEQVKMIDMLYGAILPSGADATVGLADSISGSEEGFVTLMNEKAQSLGLKNTHFVNTSGLHDENHYTTAVDMAVILEYAMQNELCRKILSTYQYTTAVTAEHPEGIPLESTMFSRMYGTEVENVTIEGGKMGYTDEAGNCLASFAIKNGKEYVAVTAGGAGKYAPIFDSFAIYENYLD